MERTHVSRQQTKAVTTATCILVIEKDGVNQRLVQDGFCRPHNCILVTGKGFPNVAPVPVYELCSANGSCPYMDWQIAITMARIVAVASGLFAVTSPSRRANVHATGCGLSSID
jgi:hypothetical protein